MKCFITDTTRRFEEHELKPRYSLKTPEMDLVKIYPDICHQSIIGFGAALTESSAYVFSQMPKEQQEQFLDLHFGQDGNRYSFCRLVIQSSDFSLSPRAYVDKASDTQLTTFSLEGDREYELPFIKAVLAKNPGLKFLASPWSPPSWAKTNRSMLFGGRLRRSKRRQWAQIIARYILEYRQEGVRIGWVTVQNEPQARQTWESCLFSAHQELSFAIEELRPALNELGLEDVRILIWDHNKERVVERAQALASERGGEAVGGIGFHWYTGDHFEALAQAREIIGPQRDLIFTEGCDAYSDWDQSQELPHAEHYAREVIGDLNAGSNGILDWNILLDRQGGPNHVGNFCDAPVMYDVNQNEMNVRLPYYYLGHFSRFIAPGAVRVLNSSFTNRLMTCCFINPDTTISLVVLNTSNNDIKFDLKVEKESILPNKIYPIKSLSHSIMTIIVD